MVGMSLLKILSILSYFIRLTCLLLFILVEVTRPFQGLGVAYTQAGKSVVVIYTSRTIKPLHRAAASSPVNPLLWESNFNGRLLLTEVYPGSVVSFNWFCCKQIKIWEQGLISKPRQPIKVFFFQKGPDQVKLNTGAHV